jgi:hypothetical protein
MRWLGKNKAVQCKNMASVEFTSPFGDEKGKGDIDRSRRRKLLAVLGCIPSLVGG